MKFEGLTKWIQDHGLWSWVAPTDRQFGLQPPDKDESRLWEINIEMRSKIGDLRKEVGELKKK